MRWAVRAFVPQELSPFLCYLKCIYLYLHLTEVALMSTKAQTKLKPTVQIWGNSMAIRIPKRIAVQVRLAVGQPVDFRVVDGSVVVTPEGKPKLSLEQLLKKFDPAIHGGEVNTGGLVGVERF